MSPEPNFTQPTSFAGEPIVAALEISLHGNEESTHDDPLIGPVAKLIVRLVANRKPAKGPVIDHA